MDVPKHSIEGYEKFNLYKKVGEHSFELPDKPPIEEIENVNLPKSEQYFRPVKFPRDFDRWTAQEKEDFEVREIDRIENGFWFFNNGNLEYITGYHYFYITYWTIKMLPDDKNQDEDDVDLENFKLGKRKKGRRKRKTKKIETPKFIDVDRDFFLLWDYVESNPYIGGLVFVTNRRDGKSYKGALIAYLTATLNSDALVGIQSKTEKDAKSILNKAVDAWQKLPYIFKPKDNGELNPQKALKFKPPSKKATKISIEERDSNDEYINSEINYGSVNEFYYDGQDLTFYMLDEAGKCHIRGTQVLMHDGSHKKVEDVKVGDLLMGNDSTPREVLSLARGKEKCYKVLPRAKGWDKWGCNESHILSLKYCANNRNKRKLKKGEIYNISVNDFLKESNNIKKHSCLYKASVDYPKKETKLDPYFLGVWLGDGNKRDVGITNTDIEIYEYLEEVAKKYDLKIRTSQEITHYLSSGAKGGKGSNRLLSVLQEENLINNKHIPNDYLINDRESRLRLLAGLIDTDGYKDPRKDRYEIIQKEKAVADGIHRLCIELGFKAAVKEKVATMKREDGSVYKCLVYRIGIYGLDLHEIPCRVERRKIYKKETIHKNARDSKKTCFTLKDIGVQEYFGFTITGNHLYLLKDCQVTHNTIQSDIHNTQQVVKETLVDGSDIVGKMYITSTVEEMEKKGGKNLFEIWKESDIKNKNPLGMTTSSCIRYFKPAYMGFRGRDKNGVPFINKYGYTDWRRAKAYLELRRASLKGEALLSYMRKYPFTEEEAFQIGLQTCWFNEENIKKTLKYNEARVTGDTLMRGDFVWSAETDKPSVEFHEHEEGRFLVSWLPKTEERNLYKGFQSDEDGSFQRMPTLNKIVGGCDPFDNKETSDGRKSDGGFHLFRKFNPMAPEGESNTFVCEYIHRPAAPQIFREDVLKAAIFYSAMVLIEKNKYGIITHFEEHGWKGYLMKRPDPTHTEWSEKNEKDPYGIPLSGEHAREYLIGTLQNYIDKYIGFDENHNLKTFMPFDRTLDDWLKFNPRKWTDFDATVSSGLALMAAESKKEVEQEDILEGLLMTFDNSGEVSKLIKN